MDVLDSVELGSALLALGVFAAGLAIGALATALAARALLRQERRAAAEKALAIAQSEVQLRDAFRSLSREALDASSASLLQLARESLGRQQEGARAELDARKQAVEAMVRPLVESLGRVDAQLREVEKERVSHTSQLVEQIKALDEGGRLLRSETQSLAAALRAPGVRGRWGELQLRRALELAGMVAHCDFVEQQTLDAERGRLRPDLVVRLPGGGQIAVDAKSPLDAFLAASEAADPAARETHLREHARHVRNHLQTLGSRAYWRELDGSPEFVVLFLPGESFFAAALAHDPQLIEHGIERRVLIASPTTLIALLRSVAMGWRQEQLAANAREIREVGRTLYERIAAFASHFESLRKGLEGAVDSYNRAVGSLEHRVLAPARKLRDLGAAPDTELGAPAPVETSARRAQPLETENAATPVSDRA